MKFTSLNREISNRKSHRGDQIDKDVQFHAIKASLQLKLITYSTFNLQQKSLITFIELSFTRDQLNIELKYKSSTDG